MGVFNGENFSIRLKTYDKAMAILKYFEENNIKWCDGDDATDWDNLGEVLQGHSYIILFYNCDDNDLSYTSGIEPFDYSEEEFLGIVYGNLKKTNLRMGKKYGLY